MRSFTYMGVLLAVMLGATRSARATTFDDTTLEALATASDLIVRGQVVAADPLPYGPGGLTGIHTRITLHVEETLAGRDAAAVVMWVQGGRLGDMLRVVHGQARFAPGEQVVVFLFRSPRGDLWPTGMARGKWLIDAEDGSLVVRPSVQLDDLGPRAVSAPQTQSRPQYRLDDLRALIRSVRITR